MNEYERVSRNLIELKAIKEALSSYSSEIGFISIGAGYFMKAKPSGEILVPVGASIYLSLTPEKANEKIEKNIKTLEKALSDLAQEIKKIETSLIELQQHIAQHHKNNV